MIGTSEHSTYHKSSIKPPPLAGGGIFISSPFEGGGGDLFNLETTVVSVLYKGLEYIVEKLKDKKFWVMQPRIRIKSKLPVGK